MTPFIPMFANIFGQQGLIILLIVVVLFGAKKLPELARGIGQSIREFKRGKEESLADSEDEKKDGQKPLPPV